MLKKWRPPYETIQKPQPKKRHPLRHHRRPGLHPHLHGICPGRQPARGIRPLRLCTPRAGVCPAHLIASVRVRRGRHAGGVGGRHVGRSGDYFGLPGGHSHRPGDHHGHGMLAAFVLYPEGGKAGQLHIKARHGRIHLGNRDHHHPDAGVEAVWGKRGNRRVVCPAVPHLAGAGVL